MSVKRIDFSLFDDELKNLIGASTKIFPAIYSYVSDGTNPNGYEYVRISSGEHKNEVYRWDGVWELIGADDKSIDWIDVKNKPSAFTPSTHNHDSSYSPTGHNHDVNYSPISHNHDTAYAVKSVEDDVEDHETRLSNIEGGYTVGHSHPNVTVLNAITQIIVDGWNSAVTHISDLVKHITSDERTLWNTVSSKANATDVTTALASKADSTTLSGHTGNTTVHVTSSDKTTWNGKTQITQGTVKPSAGYWFKEV